MNTFIALALILGFISISTVLVGSITFLCKDNKFCGKFWNFINCLSVTMTIAILGVTGYILIFASVNGNEFVQEKCKMINKQDIWKTDFFPGLGQYEDEMMKSLQEVDVALNVLNDKMCNQECPCTLASENCKSFGNDPNAYAGIGRDTGNFFCQDTAADQTFKQCLEAGNQPLAVDERYLQLYEWLENKFECSGICKKPMFYLTKDGQPTKTCADIFKPGGALFPEDQPDQYFMSAVGSIMILIAFLMFLTFVCTCQLCCYNGKKKASRELEEIEAAGNN